MLSSLKSSMTLLNSKPAFTSTGTLRFKCILLAPIFCDLSLARRRRKFLTFTVVPHRIPFAFQRFLREIYQEIQVTSPKDPIFFFDLRSEKFLQFQP